MTINAETTLTQRPLWTLRNESGLPTGELASLTTFVLEATGLRKSGKVLVRDSRFDCYHGRASWSHAVPQWAGRRAYSMSLKVPADLSKTRWIYGPHVSWHSSLLNRRYNELAAESGGQDPYKAVMAEIAAMHDAGETHWGRWPIFVVNDWQEAYVHLAAHEAAHILAADRERRQTNSEVFCEEYALRLLTAFKEASDAQAA